MLSFFQHQTRRRYQVISDFRQEVYSKYGRELVFLVVVHDNGPQHDPRFEAFAFDRRNKARAVGFGSSLQESIVDLAADWPDGRRKRRAKPRISTSTISLAAQNKLAG